MFINYDPERDEANRLQIAETALEYWRSSLCNQIKVATLYSRSPTAHKWKSPWMSMLCRELTYWRLTDLLSQVVHMRKSNQLLGSLILLRSGFETAAMLTYLNLKMQALLDNSLNFEDYNKIVHRLLAGSRLPDSETEAINVLTLVTKCNEKYPGILPQYERLCELAHPNMMGLLNGYSTFDEEEYVSIMKNQFDQSEWVDIIEHNSLTCMMMFEHENNDVFPKMFERLEIWLETNSIKLEKEAQPRVTS